MALVLASVLPALAAGCGGSSPTLSAADGRAGDHECGIQDTCEFPDGVVQDESSDSSAVWTAPECLPDCPSPPGLKWILIPSGTFSMGCSPEDEHCQNEELPAHSVTLSSFEMCETEVTEAQYATVMGVDKFCNWNGGGGPDTPAECMPYEGASTFCEAIGGRLPTEAEWEYAARAGTTTRYYCGDDPECLDAVAWHEGNSSHVKHSAGAKAPNDFGLYDMLGNVSEWTADWFGSSYYESSPLTNPQGPEAGIGKVERGGSVFDLSGWYFLRVSNRRHIVLLGIGPGLGFRCVRDVEP
jgi:formylglycine-generating enzyme required for sulfatase activity